MNGATTYRMPREFTIIVGMPEVKHGVTWSQMQDKEKIDVPGRRWDKGDPMPFCTAVERML